MVKTPIYMDYQATTPVDPRVLEAMLPYFCEHFGNAASRSHVFGWTAEEASEKARDQVASLIGGTGREIIWTSGATESINLAIKGIAHFYADRGKHIITCKTEHPAVLDTCKRLERSGYEVTYLDVDSTGRLDPEAVRAALRDDTILVAIMAANNEIGTIHPIKEIGEIVKEKGAFFHVDAVQAAGKIPFDVNEVHADLVSLSSHKMYGPKGVGALWIRRRPRVRLTPLIDGGGHERGMRSGTLNVPGVVGFGMAAEIAKNELEEEAARILELRNRLHEKIVAEVDMVHLNGHPEHRIPGNLNLSFAYVEGEGMMMALKDVALSSGSACTSASLEPSHVLRACGVDDDLAHSSLRFGIGRFTTEEEVDYVAKRVVEAVTRLREMSPLYEMAKEGIDLKSIAWTAH